MDKERRRELREMYQNRRPDMGIAAWKCGNELWAAPTTDAAADHNSSLFQLKLGSWPNREMQRRFDEDGEHFEWFLIRKLDYREAGEDHSDDLKLLMMDLLDEYPDVKPMKPGQKIP